MTEECSQRRLSSRCLLMWLQCGEIHSWFIRGSTCCSQSGIFTWMWHIANSLGSCFACSRVQTSILWCDLSGRLDYLPKLVFLEHYHGQCALWLNGAEVSALWNGDIQTTFVILHSNPVAEHISICTHHSYKTQTIGSVYFENNLKM